MITILVMWRERGYLLVDFWATESCPASQARTVARRLVAQARQQHAGVFHLRAKIGGNR
jgi:hypothetical protein